MKLTRAAGSMAATGLLLLYLALWAPTAFATAPADDDFANAQALPAGLPAEITGSNAGATKETGELVSFFAAGHSVWFKWQATNTGFVTVGSCNDSFHAILGVFEGTSVASLTKVVSGNSNEGPHCPFTESEFTFKATSGNSYEIAVDGDAFYVPPAQPPITQGEFTLRIEATPLPVNDAFQSAGTLEGEFGAEGADRFYSAHALGFNWGATKEAGEPDHNGDPGGASVWYSWTAPESGVAQVSVCCPMLSSFGIYVGDTVDALSAVGEGSSFTSLPVTAGTTYRIAVDGGFDPGAGAAWMGRFGLSVSMYLPSVSQPDPSPSSALQTEAIPPSTTVYGRRLMPGKRKAIFTFGSSEPGGRFRCKLDGHPFAACNSPKSYSGLTPGRHTFAVAAVDAAGNQDPTPASTRFEISKTTGHGNMPHRGTARAEPEQSSWRCGDAADSSGVLKGPTGPCPIRAG
jgi:hypothetical protein